jgi:Sulfotransferase family
LDLNDLSRPETSVNGQTDSLSVAASADPCRPDFDIVIILAPPRSFATMVSFMLGQHPQLYGLPESHFSTCDSIDEWTTLYRGTDRTNGALRAIAQIIFGQQVEPTMRLARQWLQARSHFTTAEVLRLLGQRAAPSILVEKTPSTAQQLEAMHRMLDEFPRARFLHLTRHPHCQAKSRLERRLSLQGNGGPKSLREAAQALGGDPVRLCVSAHQAILRFLGSVPSHQQFRVRGEDLLTSPDENLRRIALWLDIRSDDEAIEAMKHPERSAFAKDGPQNALTGGDEKFFSDSFFRSESCPAHPLDAPLPWYSDGAAFSDRIRQLARSFGYT